MNYQTRGVAHPRHVLDDDKVRAIRREYEPGVTTMHQLATRYGVSAKTIHLIIHRRSWAHVEDHVEDEE